MADVATAVTEQPVLATGPDGVCLPSDSPLVADDLLVEEISIDGMCGVY
jgi:mycofactocin precursor